MLQAMGNLNLPISPQVGASGHDAQVVSRLFGCFLICLAALQHSKFFAVSSLKRPDLFLCQQVTKIS